MKQLTVQLGQELFRFDSNAHWVQKAKGWFDAARAQHHLHRDDYVCIDATGRICRVGGDFIRAEQQGTYPIVAYVVDPDKELDADRFELVRREVRVLADDQQNRELAGLLAGASHG